MESGLTAHTFSSVRVLVIGDVMLDRYWFGDVERISPEAPVPVINVAQREERPGGAANVAANIAALGAQCTLLSVVGDDAAGRALSALLERPGITPVLQIDDKAETTVKLRVISRHQQLLRADFEAPPAYEMLRNCLGEFRRRLPEADVVCISDYGKGGLLHIKEMIEAAGEMNKPVVVDPKGDDFSRYANASMVTPNLKELEEVVGAYTGDGDLKQKAARLINELALDSLLVTKSEHGMTLYFGDGGSINCDAAGRDIYDVSGAGDTVISACALAMAAEFSKEQMLRFANTAAGIVVGKLGTAVASIGEVVAEFGTDSMIVVTGGCGFIGSNLVHGLNRHGVDDILVVDDLSQGGKFVNILDCSISDYRDYRCFVDDLPKTIAGDIEAVFHLGACSDTMERDGQYMMRVNYEYSRNLLDFCAASGIPFIYASSASVYGAGPRFSESAENESALNIYAYSKLLFDRYVRKHRASITSQVVGLRYFNVYGPREQHKGRMASVAYHFYNQLEENGYINLFEGSAGYDDGEQVRDFLWVEDAVDVNLFFLDHRDKSGIFNLGTGNARSFNDMARSVVSALNGRASDLARLIESGTIRYIPFPGELAGKYQSYTQADMNALRRIGYEKPFAPVEEGVAQYIEWRSLS